MLELVVRFGGPTGLVMDWRAVPGSGVQGGHVAAVSSAWGGGIRRCHSQADAHTEKVRLGAYVLAGRMPETDELWNTIYTCTTAADHEWVASLAHARRWSGAHWPWRA
jgi:hypothetical protein